MKYLLFAVAVIFVTLGSLIRLVETANGNYVFGFDQGLDFMAARSIAVDHKITLIGAEAGAGFAGLPGVFHGPGYRYMLAFLLFVSRGNPYGAIVGLAMLSIVTLWAIYRLGKNIFGQITAGVLLVLAAVSPPLSAQARMIWAPNYSAVVALPFLYSLWVARKKTFVGVFLAALFAALLYHFELPMAAPAMLMTVLYFAFILKLRDGRFWIAVLAGFFIGMLPMLLFESRHGWGVVRGILAYGTRVSETSVVSPFFPLKELMGDGNAIISTIRESFLFPVSWIRRVFPWILVGGTLWYAYVEKKKDIQAFVYGLVLLIFSHLLIFYPYRGPVYAHYLTLLYFVYPILGAYLVVRALHGKISRWFVYAGAVLLVIGVSMQFPKTIIADYHDFGGTAKIRGKTEALDVIYTDAAGNPFGLLVFTPPVVPYAYEYLAKWYGKNTYGYVPSFEKKPVYYLLIEPDPEKPWSYNGWLETVIKTGTVIRTWNLASGFIIQKRLEPVQ